MNEQLGSLHYGNHSTSASSVTKVAITVDDYAPRTMQLNQEESESFIVQSSWSTRYSGRFSFFPTHCLITTDFMETIDDR